MNIYQKVLCTASLVFSIAFISTPQVNAEEVKPSDAITTYTVASGDTLSEIAEKYGITTNTILWANDLTRTSKIKVGQKLVILPVSGVIYTVKAGDALESIARKYKADKQEIIEHNQLQNESFLRIGDVLIIPDGTATQTVANATAKKLADTVVKTTPVKQNIVKNTVQKVASLFFVKPVDAAIRTQGIHGNNAVDLADKEGASIYAAADGKVAISQAGWNGGYGTYIVIDHDNGMQTLYGHNSKNLVSVGDKVTQGQLIAKMGSTGKSSGDHVHFEVRGGKNPF